MLSNVMISEQLIPGLSRNADYNGLFLDGL
jgi:hypothetical protein